MLRVLATGVDRLEVSARGSLRADVLRALERAKAEAQRSRDGEPFAFASWERGFLVLPHGRRAYPYVLLGRGCGLMVRGNGELPPVRADIYSGYLDTVGAERAASAVEELLSALFVVSPEVTVSRVDVYADVQGWSFEVEDVRRFVTRAQQRRAYQGGRRCTGSPFGRAGR